MTKLSVRNLDHLVLPVPSLEISRERYNQLGFTVAPDARHKFGSENACIFFTNGTYLEPLAIGHRETVEADITKGNNFLRRDMGYRFRHGDNGFSKLAFGDPDPRTERKMLKKAGYQPGRIVTVRRPGVKVRITFGIDERSPDFTAFLCERPDGPPKFPAELTSHKNGVTGISRVVLAEHLPEDFQYYLQTMSGQREIRSHSFGMDMQLPNGVLSTFNESGMKAHYGCSKIPAGRGLRAVAMDLKVSDLNSVRKILNSSGINSRDIGERLIVDPAEGQGAIIAFVEE